MPGTNKQYYIALTIYLIEMLSTTADLDQAALLKAV